MLANPLSLVFIASGFVFLENLDQYSLNEKFKKEIKKKEPNRNVETEKLRKLKENQELTQQNVCSRISKFYVGTIHIHIHTNIYIQ